MEFILEHVEEINGSIAEMHKINKINKIKRAIPPHYLFSSNIVVLASCGRGASEVSSVRNDPSRSTASRRYVEHKKTLNHVVKR